MRVCIHRGANEIGGSCVEIISNGKRIIVDLGLPLDADKNDKKYLPKILGLDGSDDSLLAIIISHPHLDHFGLLSHVSNTIPIIMGKHARNILTNVAPFLPGKWPVPNDGPNLESEKLIEIGPFKLTPFLIDHSAYDAYSLLIEADGKRIFYSGDLRMHGRKSKLTNNLISNPPENIDVLLLEGTTIGRLDNKMILTEKVIEDKLFNIFKNSKGLILVHTSSQNIDRIVSIFRACKKTNKTLVMDLYSAVVLESTGNKNLPQSHWPNIAVYIPQSQRVQILKNKWFNLLNKHSRNRIFIETLQNISNQSVLLFRPLHINDLERNNLLINAEYIYSQWEGYWDMDSNSNVRDWLSKHNIPKISVHTSGHASVGELKHFANAIAPSKTVPIHTFEPNKYISLFNNVELHADGEWWEV